MENNEKINKLYDKMLAAGEMVSNEGITDEFVQELKEISAETVKLTEDQKTDKVVEDTEIPDGGDVAVAEKAMTSYNPHTGESMVSDKDIDVESFTKQQFDNFTSTDEVKYIKDGISKQNSKISDEDALKIAALVAKRMHGETKGFYDEMPESMKTMVNQIAATSNTNGIPSGMIKNKNTIARAIIDEFVNEMKHTTEMGMDLDSMLAGFDEDVEKLHIGVQKDLGNMMMSFDDDRKASIDAAIERCKEAGNTEGIEKLNQMKDTIDKAFNLDEFKEYCKDCKIKRFETEKVSRVFDPFNAKYENHRNVINDIKGCPAILSRHMKQYTDTQKLLVCLAFCKYCSNMSPDNMAEHTFMYYFIRNIIVIDRINPKGNIYEAMDEKFKDFYDGFTKNLGECIDNLIARNPKFAE